MEVIEKVKKKIIYAVGPVYTIKWGVDLLNKGSENINESILYGVNYFDKSNSFSLMYSNKCEKYKLLGYLSKILKNQLGFLPEQVEAYRDKNKYDVLYGCMGNHIFLLCLLKSICQYDKPIIALMHNVKDLDKVHNIFLKIFLKLYYMILFKAMDRIIFIGKNAQENAKKIWKGCEEKSKYVFLGPSKRHFPEQENTKKKYIVSAGKTKRDYFTLINAVKDLPWECVIVCEDSKDLREKCTGLANVRIIEKMPYKDLLQLYRKARVIVIPMRDSEYGMFGFTSILDALFVEKPFIVTKTKGLEFNPEKYGCGITVKEGNVEELKKRIREIIECPSEKFDLYQNNIIKFKQNNNIENSAKQILSIIEDCTNK